MDDDDIVSIEGEGPLDPQMTLSLRDYFAAHALTGLLAAQEPIGAFDDYASDAYSYSDAMLKAREQR